MCGITGFWSPGRPLPGDAERRLARMTAALAHRGPDGRGLELIAGGPALGHRRLAIVDLDPRANQPMTSADGRWTLVYNGELYERRALVRAEIADVALRTRSDTEILLEAIARRGIPELLPRLEGMFAFAAWDRHESTLWLARDRFGVKPLHWSWSDRTLIFGSELASVREWPGTDLSIDPAALEALLRFQYVPGIRTIHRSIRKLRPGTWLRLRVDDREPTIRAWWNPVDAARESVRRRERAPTTVEDVETSLRAAVHRRVRGVDVPLGAFLSGGVDSALVASFAVEVLPDLRTYSVGFEDPRYDETDRATETARLLGTKHHVSILREREVAAEVEALVRDLDEPFADSSLLPTRRVAAIASRDVRVLVGGDGADEVFAGYPRYRWAARASSLLRAPAVLRRFLHALPSDRGRAALRALRPPLRRLVRLLDLLPAEDPLDLYRRMIGRWPEPELLLSSPSRETSAGDFVPTGDFALLESLLLWDTVHYLPDDLLTKLDRATMAHGVEGRVPFLDSDLFRVAWALDDRDRWGPRRKAPLRDLLARRLPARPAETRKMGFAVPLDGWLRGVLREWAEDLLTVESLRATSLLQVEPIRVAWTRHLAGAEHAARLWPVLVFLAWLRNLPAAPEGSVPPSLEEVSPPGTERPRETEPPRRTLSRRSAVPPLPDVLLGGAQKSGTTSLHRILESHPDVYFPPRPRELHFFDLEENHRRGVDWYRSHFATWSGQARVAQTSPLYLYLPGVASRIAELLPEARLIFLLRHPADRIRSHYWHEVRYGWESLPVRRALELESVRLTEGPESVRHYSYVDRSRYSRQLERYRPAFEDGRVLLLHFSELARSPLLTWQRCLEFLGLDALPLPVAAHSRHNPTLTPRSRALQRLLRPLRSRWPGVVRRLERPNLRSGDTPPLPGDVLRALRPLVEREVRSLGEHFDFDASEWLDGSTLHPPEHDHRAGPTSDR